MKDNNSKYCVYFHTCKISNKAYIGITNQPTEKRWGKNGRRYLETYTNGEYVQPIFARALRKYPDWENDWDHIIFMDNLSEREAKQMEIRLIALFKTNACRYGNDCGYNCTDGGEGCSGRVCTEETRKKLSKSRKGKNNPMYGVSLSGEKNGMYGKHHSEETKQKLREMFSGENGPMFGKHHTEETKKKISESHKGKYSGENNPFYGKAHTDETKEKIRNAAKNRTDNKKSVVQLDDFGNLIKEWSSITDAWQTLGICRTSIPHCLNGKQKHAGGYCWEIASEYYEQKSYNTK